MDDGQKKAPTQPQAAGTVNNQPAGGGGDDDVGVHQTTIVTPTSPKSKPAKAPQSPQAMKTATMGQGRKRNDSWGDQKQSVMKMPKPIPI